MALFIIVLLLALLIWVLKLYVESKPLSDVCSKTIERFHGNMFSANFNANDFFYHSTAASVTIDESDFKWVLRHIDKHGARGLDACIAYIQNIEPLQEYRDHFFIEAIDNLIEKEQEVYGDIDYEFHGYNTEGPYRKIELHK